GGRLSPEYLSIQPVDVESTGSGQGNPGSEPRLLSGGERHPELPALPEVYGTAGSLLQLRRPPGPEVERGHGEIQERPVLLRFRERGEHTGRRPRSLPSWTASLQEDHAQPPPGRIPGGGESHHPSPHNHQVPAV